MVTTTKKTSASRREAQRETTEPHVPLWQSLTAEAIGTFFLTFVSAAPIVIGSLTAQLQNVDKVAPAGMVVAALIYTMGDISGAHFNPAVTLAFAERGSFPWRCVPMYWVAQLLGACVAGAAVAGMFGTSEHAGANMPHIGVWQSLIMEVLFSFLLLLVILGTARRHKIVGPNAALAVGLTIALCGLVGGPVSGASMNPARSLAPAIFGGALNDVWIYIVGPAIGATLATVVTTFFKGRPGPEEVDAAAGESSQPAQEKKDGG